MVKALRLGIVGMGNIGRYHAQYLLEGRVPHAVLTAVCRDKSGEFSGRGLAVFEDAQAMFRSGQVDAVLVATPHYQHVPLGIAALEAGLHVLVEKPVAVHSSEARRLVAAAERCPGQVFSVMLQMRCEPRFFTIRELLGQLGEIIRFSWTVTDWFRSEAYYSSSAWRATWKGEGGGVLINQCLHQLDILQWLLGMPSRVRAFVRLGRFHKIEVEDSVTAYLEMPNGANGVFIASTGEAPGTSRLEIAGTMGKLVQEGSRVVLTRNRVSSTEQIETAALGFGKPEATVEELTFSPESGRHAEVTRNFVDAIVTGAPLIAPGAEGVASVELANAILYSGLVDRTVTLPLDGVAYEKKLEELIAASRFEKQTRAVSGEDFGRSFSR
jgi:predicted dehydrogenase